MRGGRRENRNGEGEEEREAREKEIEEEIRMVDESVESRGKGRGKEGKANRASEKEMQSRNHRGWNILLEAGAKVVGVSHSESVS